MKKILLLFSICLIPMLGYAQTDENGKERVYIDYFSRPGTISNILAEALRNKVIEGIQKVDRVELIDVDSNEALKTEAKKTPRGFCYGRCRLQKRGHDNVRRPISYSGKYYQYAGS